jgi:hypothetical protein
MTNEEYLAAIAAHNPYGPFTPTSLLQRTFSIYREQPKLVFGLVLIMALVELIATGVVSASASQLGRGEGGGSLHALQALLFVCIALMAWLLTYLVTQVVHGAFFYAVTAQLQQRPISLGTASSMAQGRLGRLIGVSAQVALRIFGYEFLFGAAAALAVGMVAFLVHGAMGATLHTAGSVTFMLLLAPVAALGLVAFGLAVFWTIARYAIAVPACLSEDIPSSAAIWRSIHLSAKNRGRIYAMYAFVLLLGCASMALLVPMAVLSMRNGGHTAGAMFLNAVASAGDLLLGAWLVSFTGIATTLCYYDLRVRKEGLVQTDDIARDVPPQPSLTPEL